MHPIEDDAPSLSEILAVFRRRLVVMTITVAIVVSAALGWAEYTASNAEVEYQATHRLAGNPTRGVSNVALEQNAILVRSGPVRDTAREELDGHPGVTVRAGADIETGTVSITARGEDPEAVEVVANTYATILLDRLNEEDRATYEEQIAEQQAQVDETAELVDVAQVALAQDPENSRLIAERDSAINSYRAALDTLRAITSSGLPDPQMKTLSRADASEVPLGGYAGLPFASQVAVALSIALLVAIGLAYVFEALDRRLTSAEATAEAFGVPVLTEVPYGGKRFAKSSELAPAGSVVTEAYRQLRTIVQLVKESATPPHEGATVILVTSPGPEEGKTTTVAHLARALAEVGSRVLLISGDFRRPRLHRYFGAEASRGLADGSVGPSELVQKTDHEGVSLVTAGHGSSHTTELIKRARQAIQEGRGSFDYILIDSSPLLSANDALDFVQDADSVIPVVRARKTNANAADRAREMLRRTSAPVTGVVITGVRRSDSYGYYYGDYAPRSTSGRKAEKAATR